MAIKITTIPINNVSNVYLKISFKILWIIKSRSSNINDQVPPTVPTANIDIEITIMLGFSITSTQFIFCGSTKNLKIAITPQ